MVKYIYMELTCMKKNTTLTLLLLLIIMLLVILGFKMYEDYNSDDVTKSIYSFEAYPLYIDNYIFINSEINNNKMYLFCLLYTSPSPRD